MVKPDVVLWVAFAVVSSPHVCRLLHSRHALLFFHYHYAVLVLIILLDEYGGCTSSSLVECGPGFDFCCRKFSLLAFFIHGTDYFLPVIAPGETCGRDAQGNAQCGGSPAPGGGGGGGENPNPGPSGGGGDEQTSDAGTGPTDGGEGGSAGNEPTDAGQSATIGDVDTGGSAETSRNVNVPTFTPSGTRATTSSTRTTSQPARSGVNGDDISAGQRYGAGFGSGMVGLLAVGAGTGLFAVLI